MAINSAKISMETLQHFHSLLCELNARAAEIEKKIVCDSISHEKHRIDALERIDQYLRIGVLIESMHGDVTSSFNVDLITSKNLPQDISVVRVSNCEMFLWNMGFPPSHTINAWLNFRQVPVSLETLDDDILRKSVEPSYVEIFGLDEQWVLYAAAKVEGFFAEIATTRSWIHRRSTYYLFFFFMAIPAVGWLSFKLDAWLKGVIGESYTSISLFIFITVFYMAGGASKLFYQYVAWAFPLMEFEGRMKMHPARHRFVAFAILMSVLGALAYDVAKTLIPAIGE